MTVAPVAPTRPRAERRRTARDGRHAEIRARHALADRLAAMERAHASALRDLERFEAYLADVRRDLRASGFLRGV